MPRNYKEESINLPAGNLPPKIYKCDCGNELCCPEYICEHCKKQFVFYVPMEFINFK